MWVGGHRSVFLCFVFLLGMGMGMGGGGGCLDLLFLLGMKACIEVSEAKRARGGTAQESVHARFMYVCMYARLSRLTIHASFRYSLVSFQGLSRTICVLDWRSMFPLPVLLHPCELFYHHRKAFLLFINRMNPSTFFFRAGTTACLLALFQKLIFAVNIKSSPAGGT